MNEFGKTLKILNQTFDKILNISSTKTFVSIHINNYNNQNHNYVIDKENL